MSYLVTSACCLFMFTITLLFQKETERNFKCQPYIWDFPGLQDEENENIIKILRMIINGKVDILQLNFLPREETVSLAYTII